LCGKDHGFMPVVVVAKTEEDYNKWLASMKDVQTAALESADREWSMDELLAKGEQVYGKTCAACHQANGQGIPGVFPSIVGSPVATGPIEDHVNIVLNGKQGTAMQAFAEQLSESEIAAVITYQRNAWDNQMGDLVQPATIKASR
jgi:cytochrome c oxidase subunit 2